LFKQWKDYVRCYPLLIFNSNNKKPAYIWHYRYIQEAKDVDGVWKPIEYFYNHPTCIVTKELLKLKAKNYLAIPIIKYKGDFKTKLRIKMQIDDEIYFSNEITGYINRTQFDSNVAKRNILFWRPTNEKDHFDKYIKKMIFLEND
jgi:hypothetical protein